MTAVAPSSRESHSRFASNPVTQRYFLEDPDSASAKSPDHGFAHVDYPSPVTSSTPSPIPSPDFTRTTAKQLFSTPTTLRSISFNDARDDDNDGEIVLPSYDGELFLQGMSPPSEASLDSLLADTQLSVSHTPAVDDTSIEEEPSRHVDYLSHEWREEDIWASWRYVVARRRTFDNAMRLENASWRTWAKLKLNLGTVSPEALNWLKDCDVTWLYGPLKTCNALEKALDISPPPSCETPNLYLDRKSILKKRTASETILQRSLSQHTLLQHAGAILKAQEAESHRYRSVFSSYQSELGSPSNQSYSRPSQTPLDVATASNSPSGIASPSGRRHIHFNDEVVQCIAVEAKDDEWPCIPEDESSSDDGVYMKQMPTEALTSSRSTPRGSFSNENKTIAPLPPTTLKYRGDTPEPQPRSIMDRWSGYLSSPRSSSSVETIRLPESSSTDFFLDEDPNTSSLDWGQNQDLQVPEVPSRPWFVNPGEDEELDQHFNLTSGGLFSSDDEGDSSNINLFHRVIDTFNTARDIAHVIWNVGWRR